MFRKIKSSIKKHYMAVRWRVILYIAWKNLVTKKLRTALTVTGVVVGIGSVFFLLSFGLGIQELVTKQIIGNQSVKTIDITTLNSRVIKLDRQNVEKIQNMSHVSLVGVQYAFAGSIGVGGGAKDIVTYGVDSNYLKLIELKLVAGELLSNDDNKSAVINSEASRALGFKDEKSAIGKTVNLLVPLQNVGAKKDKVDKKFTIVGVVNTGSGSEVYVPSFHFDQAGVASYSQVRLLVDEVENTPVLRKSIEALGFQTVSPSDTIDQVNQIFSIFNIVMIAFGSIGMLIAILGMFNTLTISLLERTREIGLMMALGGRERDMSKLFIVESLLLSVLGAIVGIVLAVITGQILNSLMMAFSKSRGVSGDFQLFAYPVWLIAAVIVFMALVGMLVAYFPARRARKINPIDALRRE